MLVEAGEGVGLDGEALRGALSEGRYTDKVVADEGLARRLGVYSVPTMFVVPEGAPPEAGERITGAQPHGGRIEAAVEKALRSAREKS